jgi:Ca2+-binding RTX toxin-like protein/pimeloyl-ACP methyl ester carboxylesterase
MVTVNDYAALSAAAYGNSGVGNASEIGWIRLKEYQNTATGFYAALFENSEGERVLAFRGTDRLSSPDWQTNISVLEGKTPKQFDDALSVYAAVAEQYGTNRLSLTGHSLGGGLASYVAAQTANASMQATVFNSLGVANLVPSGSYSNIQNYNSAADLVTLFGPSQIGNKNSFEGQRISSPILTPLGILAGLAWFFVKNHLIDPMVSTNFLVSRTIAPARDPLILDLDGDGLETVGIDTAAPILFDHDGDGVKTANGWIKGDDAFLVLDRNGNGVIDSGRELFGDTTPLVAGSTAADGFAALAQEDTNDDGLVNASDTRFASLRLWRDANQDGLSQADELVTFAAQNITALKVGRTANSTALANGNQIADVGGFVRSDGTVGQLADVNLAGNAFYSEFTDNVPLTDQAQALPEMQGAGMVRSLRQAASLQTPQGGVLAAQLSAFSAETTRSGQTARLDALLKAWADTSSMATTAGTAFAGVNLTLTFAGVTKGTPAWQTWLDKLSILERFNGQTFLPVPAAGSTLAIDFYTTREALLEASYAALKESVYGALVMQTRLKPYLDQISLAINENGIALDFSALEAAMDAQHATDAGNALIDRIELMKYAGALHESGWECVAKLSQWIGLAEGNGTWEALRTSLGATYTGAPTTGNDFHVMGLIGGSYDAGAGDDLVIGAGGSDTLYGTDGSDRLYGGDGNDTLSGGAGDDTLDGGAGSDYLDGGNGNDCYFFRRGNGNDTISNYDSTTGRIDTLVLDGLNATDIRLEKHSNYDLAFVIKDTGESITAQNFFYDNIYKLDTVKFADGSTWNRAAILDNVGVYGTSANDTLSAPTGVSSRLYGYEGSDTLFGNNANDVLDGGTGADNLCGGSGDDTYVVDAVGDLVTESFNQGTDTVQSSITYTLTANVENLTLTGTAAINGTGNTLNNVLIGNSAANILDGGTDADILIGGLGNDTYVVDNLVDAINEATGEGTDQVKSSVTYTLAANVENLTLTGAAAINGSGNNLNNVLTGNASANTLSGGLGNDTLNGGVGADTLIGGVGDDAYYVDNAADSVVELANEGNDIVYSTLGWTLGANQERLYLTGTAVINATGNALANTLYGNANSNANVLSGGLGNDVYYAGANDGVVELAGEGSDSVYSYGSFALGANVENLTLNVATEALLTGNELANSIRGNAGNDFLSGGAGNDKLNGAAGNDILEGGDGNDGLTDTSGTTLFNGGAGNDVLSGGVAAEIYLGGVGNDTVTTGTGNDVVLFNEGDGQDTLVAGTTGSDTVSLGGGIAYTDLSFSKSSNNLVLRMGASDQLTFKDWYLGTTNRNVLNLQIVAEAMAGFSAGGSDALLDQKIENFDFKGLVGAFDDARAATPTLSSWALTNALTQFHLAGSDSAALGGDLAYQYGSNGTLSGIGVSTAQQVLGETGFGGQAQTLHPLAGLQVGTQRLA